MTTLSVVIPACNRPAELGQCLEALAREAAGAGAPEVIVVDDGSKSESRQRIEKACAGHGAAYVRHEQGRGPAAARNTGWRRAQGQWIAFLDDDVVPRKGWLSAVLAQTGGADEGVAGIEGAVIPMGSGVWDEEVANRRGGLFLTANMVYRRRVLEQIGGFDEAFTGPFGEDQELAVRARQQGRLDFSPDFLVLHQPRNIRLIRWLLQSAVRMRRLLDAEFHFYMKHRDTYHSCRHHTGFFGTLMSLCGRNVFISLKRRPRPLLTKHPLQTAVLAAGALIEQITACLLAPSYVCRFLWRSLCESRGLE